MFASLLFDDSVSLLSLDEGCSSVDGQGRRALWSSTGLLISGSRSPKISNTDGDSDQGVSERRQKEVRMP